MSVVRDVVESDPIERERWAREWLRAEAERFRALKGNPQGIQAELKRLLDSFEEVLAVLIVTMVKEEYQDAFADFIEAFNEMKQSVRGNNVPPVGHPGMPR